MDLLTSEAIAFLTLLAKQTYDTTTKKLVNKTSDKVTNILLTQANKILQLIKNKFPDKFNKLEEATNNSSDVIDAEVIDAEVIEEVINEVIEKDTKENSEIKTELENLGKMIQENKEAKQIIENWKGINIKGGVNTVQNNTLNFN